MVVRVYKLNDLWSLVPAGKLSRIKVKVHDYKPSSFDKNSPIKGGKTKDLSFCPAPVVRTEFHQNPKW